ncbi:MAG: tRNA epoxyqueuosine(34) reductase QueG [Anaerolineales bacterium]
MDSARLTQQIKAKAQELGFSLVGVTSAQPPEHMDKYRKWLAAGYHGDMAYLAKERALQRRADPRNILPECQSILVLGIPYNDPSGAPQAADAAKVGRIAAYAWGEDYHRELRPRLQSLVEFIEQQVGHAVPNRWYTDSGPLLERELAQRAGLGWIGRNSMLINPERGSYFLLAEILLGIELQTDMPLDTDHCGSCTRCLDACPTQCILPDRSLEATRCISYLTIELRGATPPELRDKMGDWVFGCDICQVVCPWNERFASENGDAAFVSKESKPWLRLEADLRIDTTEFNRKFKTRPVLWTKRRGYLRNLAVAAGNSADRAHVPALIDLLQDETEPLARGHAAWALGKLGGDAAKAALALAENNEKDAWVLEEIKLALETRGINLRVGGGGKSEVSARSIQR